jgi:hypothetical protein
MIRRVQRGGERGRRQAVGAVLVVLPTLVEDDVALRLEAFAGQRRQQITHPIGFHPERQIEGAGGNHFPVIRAIGVGRSVQQAAGLLQRREVAGVVMFGTLEHQVLEQVRKAGPSWTLVLGSDVVPEVHGNDGDVVVLMDDDVEAVGQRVFGERDFEEGHFGIVWQTAGGAHRECGGRRRRFA